MTCSLMDLIQGRRLLVVRPSGSDSLRESLHSILGYHWELPVAPWTRSPRRQLQRAVASPLFAADPSALSVCAWQGRDRTRFCPRARLATHVGAIRRDPSAGDSAAAAPGRGARSLNLRHRGGAARDQRCLPGGRGRSTLRHQRAAELFPRRFCCRAAFCREPDIVPGAGPVQAQSTRFQSDALTYQRAMLRKLDTQSPTTYDR